MGTFLIKTKAFLKGIYEKLVGINDSPQRIAIGFGLGVFLGILPGVGPIASLVLAALFRVNKAAAIAGSLLTNTWLSVVGFLLAIKIGAWATNNDWNEIANTYRELFKNFHWQNLFNTSFLNVISPLVIGYVLFSLVCGIAAYGVALLLLKFRNKQLSV